MTIARCSAWGGRRREASAVALRSVPGRVVRHVPRGVALPVLREPEGQVHGGQGMSEEERPIEPDAERCLTCRIRFERQAIADSHYHMTGHAMGWPMENDDRWPLAGEERWNR